MRIDVSIADTVVGWIGFITLGRALHADAGEFLSWQTPSQRLRVFRKPAHGTLLVGDDGVEFIYERWAYVDMDSFELSAEEPTPNSYQNRPGHELVRHP